MDLIGVLLGFIVILLLNSRKVNMGLSLFSGAVVAGILSSMGVQEIISTIYQSAIEPMTIQLMVIVVGISGLGYILKQTGDLDKMIDSLIAIFRDGKILSMLLPVLIGTLSVPGGAILSAPMIDESGDRVDLNNSQKTSINLFFRHIGFLIYPLYGSMILTSKLFNLGKATIIKYNFLIMLAGIIAAYFVFFNQNKGSETPVRERTKKLSQHIVDFFMGFSPILIVLLLAFIFNVPFHFAIFAGLLLAVSRLVSFDGLGGQIKDFLLEGINYNLAGLILGVMIFKGIVEASGAVDGVANYLLNSGIPMTLMIIILGLVTGYLTGINMAALGILIPLFIPLFTMDTPGPYISLLFTTSFLGYLISPIHLCLVLTKEYFETGFKDIYRPLYIPMAAMIITGLIQIAVFS